MALRAPKQSIGERLRSARSERGVDLDRAARDTGLDRRDLEALERDAAPEEFRGSLYARIFLREYARYLGLNPRPLVDRYRHEHPERERPLIGGPVPVERTPAWWLKPLLVALSVGVLAGLVVASVRSDRPDVAVLPRTMAPSPASPAATPSPEEPEAPSRPADRLVLDLRVVDAPSWIRVLRGDEVVLEETLEPGDRRTFRAREELGLVFGNASAVRLTANGERLPLPASTVASFRVVLRDGEPRLTEPA